MGSTVPVTKLGRLVETDKIKSLEQVYLHSLPVKECQIIDKLLPNLKDEVMKIMSVQKQTRAGFCCSKEVATTIRGAIILAKLSVIPVRRGYWGNKIGSSCKKILQFAGIDVFTSSSGSTRTLVNFVKLVNYLHTPEVETQLGFGWVRKLNTLKVDRNFLRFLHSRFRPQTGTFYLGNKKYKITVEDVICLTGLKAVGEQIYLNNELGWKDLSQSNLGLVPEASHVKSGAGSLAWLETNFRNVQDPTRLKASVRAYLLYVIDLTAEFIFFTVARFFISVVGF